MTKRGIRALAVAAALALSVTACGGSDEATTPVKKDVKFEAGTTMAKLNQAGSINVGVKFDQPGIGFKKPGSDSPEGFDVEIAKIIAAKLGIEPSKIKWTETVSKNREPFLSN